jgi:hypothetical protein
MCAFRLVAIEAKGESMVAVTDICRPRSTTNLFRSCQFRTLLIQHGFRVRERFRFITSRIITHRPPVDSCDAIRAKKDWSHKILDTTRNLGLKWATEAGIDDPANDGVFPALEYGISLS